MGGGGADGEFGQREIPPSDAGPTPKTAQVYRVANLLHSLIGFHCDARGGAVKLLLQLILGDPFQGPADSVPLNAGRLSEVAPALFDSSLCRRPDDGPIVSLDTKGDVGRPSWPIQPNDHLPAVNGADPADNQTVLSVVNTVWTTVENVGGVLDRPAKSELTGFSVEAGDAKSMRKVVLHILGVATSAGGQLREKNRQQQQQQ